MARPRKCRRICKEPAYDSFVPEGIFCRDEVVLSLDEYEVIRLIDLENRTHEQCAGQMEVSRTTVTEIYEAARQKVADCIVNGKPLRIAGGIYKLCDGSAARYCRKACRRSVVSTAEYQGVQAKGANVMRIAVTYENGEIFQHFGHTAQFKLYDITSGEIVRTMIADTEGQGHGALTDFLSGVAADTLICGGIGAGAKSALQEAGIKLYGGVKGSADEAVGAYLNGSLDFDEGVTCSHHGHGDGADHDCGSHGHGEGHTCGNHGHGDGHACGEDRHGCAGNR